MKEFYAFTFPKGTENEGLFAEFLPNPEDQMTVNLYASEYPHPVSKDLEETKKIQKELLSENSDMPLDIVKVSLQFESIE